MRRARSVLMAALATVAALASLPACQPSPAAPDGGSGGHPTGCTLAFLGDESKAPEVQPLALGPDMTAVPLHAEDMVLLAFPPQGGRVIFAGVRATNLDPCGVELGGALRDETTQQVRLDTRTVNLRPGGDGWGASDPTDISTFANVPVCPNEWSKTNLYGTEYQLELTVTDRAGRTVTLKLPVTPECSEPVSAAVCRCICMGGYVLGESCAPDGGTGDGGTDGGGTSDGGTSGAGGGDGGT
jgi:hypothetical protein